MRSLVLNFDVDTRWGIERWENEGGRVRFGTTVSNGLNRPPDADRWTRELSHSSREAGLSVWPDAPTNFSLGSKVDEEI